MQASRAQQALLPTSCWQRCPQHSTSQISKPLFPPGGLYLIIIAALCMSLMQQMSTAHDLWYVEGQRSFVAADAPLKGKQHESR